MTIGVRRFSAEPVTPTEEITCLAWKSENGSRLEKCRRLWKNCERRLETSVQFVVLAFLMIATFLAFYFATLRT